MTLPQDQLQLSSLEIEVAGRRVSVLSGNTRYCFPRHAQLLLQVLAALIRQAVIAIVGAVCLGLSGSGRIPAGDAFARLYRPVESAPFL